MSNKIGQVTKKRYQQIVTEARRLVEKQSQIQFSIGDMALEIEPMRPRGGATANATEELHTVEEALALFAEDIGIPARSVEKYRWVAARWPKKHRQPKVSHAVHSVLADIPDEEERWEVIKRPPLHERSGTRRWTLDAARRELGHQVDHPVSVQEKVQAIHDMARDETVATRVTTDFLRRPDVAFKAMTDSTARHLVNQAQFERSRQAGEVFRRESPAAPAIERIEHAMEFLDLVGACQQFVAGCGRVVPQLREQNLSDDECTVLHKNISRVRATADWIETAIDTGDVDMDEELSRLLKGE
jgi:hypothetical protein